MQSIDRLRDNAIVSSVDTPSPRQAALFVNTKARRGREWFAQAKQALADGGIDLIEARAIGRPRDMPAIVERHVLAGTRLVVVGGGDGTFSAIASMFAGRQTILGVLPLGTGNSFARDLGIPAEIEAACDAIVNGTVAKVDMGIIGNGAFVNVATVGLSSLIALDLDDRLKKKLGRMVYLVALVRALSAIRPFRVRLALPSGVHEFDCLQLVIGNGRFHAGPFPVTPDASITAGWLAVYALASRRKLDFLKMALRMRGGRHVDLAEVKAFRIQSGELSATPIQRITVDGEPRLETPVRFGIMPNALSVMVPRSLDAPD